MMKTIKKSCFLAAVVLGLQFMFFNPAAVEAAVDLSEIPEYSGSPYTIIDDNEPEFSDEDFVYESFEYYADLDWLGRCQEAVANIGQDLMPTEPRGDIGSVKPSGWQLAKYDIIDGKYLYNRCHLIGYQLTAENANKNNLITGTRYMNVQGMLPFENMTADFIKETGYHVLYRVTPIFEGDNLVASGVQMEAMSVEDRGESVMFNVYCYNVQPGVSINYATGEASETVDSGQASESQTAAMLPTADSSSENRQVNAGISETAGAEAAYVLNTNTRKFHLPSCPSASDISPENRMDYYGTREALILENYTPCGRCKP